MLSVVSAAAVVGGVVVAAAVRERRFVPAAVLLAAAVSLGVTAAYLVRGGGRGSELLLVEGSAMIALLFLVVRRAPGRQAAVAAGLAVVAGVAMIVPDPPPDDPFSETLAGIGFWLLFGLGALGAATYVNALYAGRARSVSEARRGQRLELARDLHDFVAHDVTGIVVQAQAAQVAAERDPEEAVAALKRIEEAGLAALAQMDRSLRALRALDGEGSDAGDEARQERRRYGLEDVPELTERFAATGAAEVRLTLEQELLDELEPPVSEACYRVAVEGLTNVRRHAPAATRVEISAARDSEGRQELVLAVVDDGGDGATQAPALARAGEGGGSGLLELRERVETLGGTLTAGPRRGGWEVRAVLPLPGGASTRAAR
ncbi:MAG TPA: histidine kinase [Gaiellaceae bacterium]|nr:histidine kinase [Gaiellaceae bacterium]